MSDSDINNTVNVDINDDNVNDNENNGDPENNVTQNIDNETTTTNTIHRNNFTARDHLFQAMFSRIALTYDRTFPPFARRFIEFMLLITALSVLFILIYIHLAFVKAPITCLDHFSFEELLNHGDSSMKHVVIRVEILNNPPLNYGLFNSYSKEYDDMSTATIYDKNSSIVPTSKNEFNQMAMFLNVVHKKCHKGSVQSDGDGNDSSETTIGSDTTKENGNADQNQSESSFYKLFHFPINPIIEKAEYWREKLSVRAMAPFRQTFNDLELFAKSVFTEEKYIMEYSLEYGLLRLSPQTRERLNIPVHFILLDATKDKCFGNALSRFILEEFVGYDQIIIGSLKRLAERQSGKGYVRNVVSGEHYRFVNSWMSRTSYLAAGFIMIIFTLSVSMLLRYSHHQIFVFIVDLLRMLENNLQFSFPAAPLLTVVLALVGMEAIMSEFFNDTSTAFYTILIIWLADQYEAVCCRTFVSKRHWPRYFYLYHFAFYAYHYRFNGQFSGLALLCSWLFIQHSMFFFFHHYELPRLMQGIAVRAIMDSLIVERAENTASTGTSLYRNEEDDDDDDSDLPGGDRRDNDEDPGSSTVQSLRTMNGSVPRMGDYKPPSPHDNTTTNHRSSENNHNNVQNGLNSEEKSARNSKKRYLIKKCHQPPCSFLKKFPNEYESAHCCSSSRRYLINVVPSLVKHVSWYRDEIIDHCVSEKVITLTIGKLKEIIVDQVGSIITMLALTGITDSVQLTVDRRIDSKPKTIIARLPQRHTDEKRSHHRLVNEYIKKKEQRSIAPKVKPIFTLARNYNQLNCHLNKKSLMPAKHSEHIFAEKLFFADKHAVSLKMSHQTALSVEWICADSVDVAFNDAVTIMSRTIDANMNKLLFERLFGMITNDLITVNTDELSGNYRYPAVVVMGDGRIRAQVGVSPLTEIKSRPLDTNLLQTDQWLIHQIQDIVTSSNAIVSLVVKPPMERYSVMKTPVTLFAVKSNIRAALPYAQLDIWSSNQDGSPYLLIGTKEDKVPSMEDTDQLNHVAIEDLKKSHNECTVLVMDLSLERPVYLMDYYVDDGKVPLEVNNDCAIPLFDLFPKGY